MDLAQALRAALGEDRVRREAPLAPLTTFRVGGSGRPAGRGALGDEALAALRLAREAGVPLTWLGGGSNVLVGDRGVRGLVRALSRGRDRLDAPDRVRAEAGVTVNGLVRYTIGHGLAGLAAWAGTPGTLGGAVYGNAHFQGRLISEGVVRSRLASRTGRCARSGPAEMEFGYDRSRLQRTGEVALAADFARRSRASPRRCGTRRGHRSRSASARSRSRCRARAACSRTPTRLGAAAGGDAGLGGRPRGRGRSQGRRCAARRGSRRCTRTSWSTRAAPAPATWRA